MELNQKPTDSKDTLLYAENLYTPEEKNETELFLEAAGDTYIIKTKLYPIVESVLSTSMGDRKFKDAVGKFIDRNNDKLKTPGPLYMIAFTDIDKAEFFNIFGISPDDVVKLAIEITSTINASDFKYLKQNPVFWLFLCCIRYYTIKKDVKGVNTALIIYSLSVYPSIFNKYFKYEVSSPGVMAYTIDSLTDKFIIKKQNHIFGALTFSIQNSYKFLQRALIDGSDKECIRFIQRIRNDQNSMIKKISDQYYKNQAKGLSIGTALDTGAEGEIIDSYTNDTSEVESTTRGIILPLLENGVNMNFVEAAAKISQISVSEVRFFMSKILIDEEFESIVKFIEAILFVWLYYEKKARREINSSDFLLWSLQLFRKTNSNDKNIVTIKETLNHWGDMSGLHGKFTREASRINYKKAFFFYFILAIQYYNNKN